MRRYALVYGTERDNSTVMMAKPARALVQSKQRLDGFALNWVTGEHIHT